MDDHHQVFILWFVLLMLAMVFTPYSMMTHNDYYKKGTICELTCGASQCSLGWA